MVASSVATRIAPWPQANFKHGASPADPGPAAIFGAPDDSVPPP